MSTSGVSCLKAPGCSGIADDQLYTHHTPYQNLLSIKVRNVYLFHHTRKKLEPTLRFELRIDRFAICRLPTWLCRLVCKWSRGRDSNPEPVAYKTTALAIELPRHMASLERLELSTYRLEVCCSVHLSYRLTHLNGSPNGS